MTKTAPTKNAKQDAPVPKFKKDKEGKWCLTKSEGNESIKQQWMRIFGTQDSDAFEHQLKQILPVIGCVEEEKQHEGLNQLIPLMQSIAPNDELEGMLAIQMIGVHTMAMEMMKRAMISDQTVDGVSNKINRLTKLTRTFIAQMAALDKHRSKGQQKMTVEHVHVNEGGQAVIGNVGRGEDEKKK